MGSFFFVNNLHISIILPILQYNKQINIMNTYNTANLIQTLYATKSGYGHYRVSIELHGKQLTTITSNMPAIDAAFDEYYDDNNNEGKFYESRLEAQEALINETLLARENEYDAECDFEKRNFINEIRYQDNYYDNDEEIRIS